jgi:DNA-binding response OmpR family regulator
MTNPPPPDLILLDIMMPDMDGHEVCRRLKTNQETRGIPIIFLTSKTRPEDIVAGFRLGAVDYVKKPFQAEELTARVDTHVRLKKDHLPARNGAKGNKDPKGLAAHLQRLQSNS